MTNRLPPVDEDSAGEAHAKAARPSGWTNPGDHQAWSIRSMLAPTAIAARCVSPRFPGAPMVSDAAPGTPYSARIASFCSNPPATSSTPRRAESPDGALEFHDPADDPAVVDDQLDEAGVQMSCHGGIAGHRGEEPADERPAAGEQVGLRRTEAFVVQRSTNQPLNRPSRLSGTAFETM